MDRFALSKYKFLLKAVYKMCAQPSPLVSVIKY